MFTFNSDGSFTLHETHYGTNGLSILVGDNEGIYVVFNSVSSITSGNANFMVSLYKESVSVWTIVGIMAGCVAFWVLLIISLICCIKWYKKKMQKRKEIEIRQPIYININKKSDMRTVENMNCPPPKPAGTSTFSIQRIFFRRVRITNEESK